MSDRRLPKLWTWGCGMDAPEFSANHTHEMECLRAVDPVAAVRRGVESGTIKGFQLEPDEPFDWFVDGQLDRTIMPGTYLVIPVSDGGSET